MKDVSLTGGTERVTVNLANLFLSKGNHVTIVSYFHGKERTSYMPDEKVKIVYLVNEKCPDRGNCLKRILLFYKALNALKFFFKHNRVDWNDIVISQNFFSNVLLLLSGKVKYAIGCEHFKYEVYPPLIRVFRCCVYAYFKRIVTLTEQDRNRFIKHLNPTKVFTIPNMVAIKEGVVPNEQSKDILALGRLVPQKGFDMLISAMKYVSDKYPDWKVDIFGEGECKEELQEEIVALGLEKNVLLRGYTDDVYGEFSKHAFFVLSSRFEGFPLVLIEALGQGMPSLAFDCPEGPAQLLETGGGILVENGNVRKLSESIIYMIEHPNFRHDCIAHKEYIREYLSPNVIYDKWCVLFNGL